MKFISDTHKNNLLMPIFYAFALIKSTRMCANAKFFVD
nr:MAG TPA: hypothetical protein [Caudoviricetes sp.]